MSYDPPTIANFMKQLTAFPYDNTKANGQIHSGLFQFLIFFIFPRVEAFDLQEENTI